MSLSMYETTRNNGILQRKNSSGRIINFCGYYDGVRDVQCRVLSSSNVVLIDWTDAVLDVTNNFFYCPIQCSHGLYFKGQARYTSDDGTIITQQNVWGIGSLIAIAGESNGCELFYHGTSISPSFAYNKEYRKEPQVSGENAPKTWLSPYSQGDVNIANAIYVSNSTLPLGFIELCQDTTTMANWLDTNHAVWTRTIQTINECGGNLEAFVFVHGANDAAAGTTKADYKAGLCTLQSRVLSLLGKDAANFLFIITKVGSVGLTGATTARVTAIRDAQTEFANENTGVYVGATMEGLALSDGTHLQRNAASAGVFGYAIGQCLNNHM